jgi:sec-independent protein translocase protein TatB
MDFLGLGIGVPQLLLVLVVALIVLGPERLPEVARQLARGIRQLRGYATDVQSQFGGELSDIREELLGIQRDLSEVQGSLRGGLQDLDVSLRSVQGEFQGAAASVNGVGMNDAANGVATYTPEAPAAPQPPAGPPEFKPETPPSLRLNQYRQASQPGGPENDMREPGSRLPDYKPPV